MLPHPDCASKLAEPVHFSNLKHMSASPAHYLTRLCEPSDSTPAMQFGTLVHSILLEPDAPISIWDGDRRSKAWTAFKEEKAGTLITTVDDYTRAEACADSVRTRPYAMDVLVGQYEASLQWSWLGRACSSRLDCLGASFVTDLKTASTVQPDRFRAACTGRFNYHAQLGFYVMAAEHAGRRIEAAYIVGVETSAPYDVTVLKLTARALDQGQRLCRVWMERLLSCEASGTFPGYTQSVLDLDVPDANDLELIIDGEIVEAA